MEIGELESAIPRIVEQIHGKTALHCPWRNRRDSARNFGHQLLVWRKARHGAAVHQFGD